MNITFYLKRNDAGLLMPSPSPLHKNTSINTYFPFSCCEKKALKLIISFAAYPRIPPPHPPPLRIFTTFRYMVPIWLGVIGNFIPNGKYRPSLSIRIFSFIFLKKGLVADFSTNSKVHWPPCLQTETDLLWATCKTDWY